MTHSPSNRNSSLPSPRDRLVVTSSSILDVPIDVEARIRAATDRDTLKGMFFRRVVDMATGAGVTAASAGIRSPVPSDRYVNFSDYPVADYFRWASAAAKALHPRVPLSEGIRRVGGRDFGEFAGSRVGSITLAFTGGAKGTLAKCGMLYAQVLKGPTVEAEATTEGVAIRFRNYRGPVEVYPVGTIEGTCKHFGADYSIEITIKSPTDADYFVRVAG